MKRSSKVMIITVLFCIFPIGHSGIFDFLSPIIGWLSNINQPSHPLIITNIKFTGTNRNDIEKFANSMKDLAESSGSRCFQKGFYPKYPITIDTTESKNTQCKNIYYDPVKCELYLPILEDKTDSHTPSRSSATTAITIEFKTFIIDQKGNSRTSTITEEDLDGFIEKVLAKRIKDTDTDTDTDTYKKYDSTPVSMN